MTQTEPDIDGQIRLLTDRQLIARLPVDYANGLDRGDWDLVRSCFTDDAEVEGSVDTLPIDQVLARSKRLAATYVANTHFIGNVQVDLHGDEAVVTSYVIAYHWKIEPAGRDHPDNLIAGGRYHDRVRRKGDRWFIAHRRIHRDWNIGTTPAMGR